MEFLILCGVLSFLVQIILMNIGKQRGRSYLYWIVLPIMEAAPLLGAGFYGIVRPDSFFGWEFNVVLCLWIAGSVLLGYAAACIIVLLFSKKN